MKYSKNYCEEKGISTSELNESQRTLYYIAENMKMDKSISEEGYRHFQMAINALGQDDVLDKIRAEIMQVANEEKVHDEKWALGLRYAIKIIDKYREGDKNDSKRSN